MKITIFGTFFPIEIYSGIDCTRMHLSYKHGKSVDEAKLLVNESNVEFVYSVEPKVHKRQRFSRNVPGYPKVINTQLLDDDDISQTDRLASNLPATAQAQPDLPAMACYLARLHHPASLPSSPSEPCWLGRGKRPEIFFILNSAGHMHSLR